MTRKVSILAVALLVGSFAALPAVAAEPTLHEVYQAAEAGRTSEALGMMDQVLRAHPNSGKAHFVEAELLAKEGKLAEAKAELANADRLAPGLTFATPQSVQALKARLNGSPATTHVANAALAPPASQGLPWGLIMLVVAAIGAFFLFRRSNQRPAGGGVPMAGGPGYGPAGVGQPGGGMMPGGGGMGSGIMGGLASGVALGAGVVAGEALAHKLMDGGEHPHQAVGNNTGNQPWDVGPDTGTQQDFGITDNSSWDSGSGGGGGDDWN